MLNLKFIAFSPVQSAQFAPRKAECISERSCRSRRPTNASSVMLRKEAQAALCVRIRVLPCGGDRSGVKGPISTRCVWASLKAGRLFAFGCLTQRGQHCVADPRPWVAIAHTKLIFSAHINLHTVAQMSASAGRLIYVRGLCGKAVRAPASVGSREREKKAKDRQAVSFRRPARNSQGEEKQVGQTQRDDPLGALPMFVRLPEWALHWVTKGARTRAPCARPRARPRARPVR